jgi:2-iminoacetate synthase
MKKIQDIIDEKKLEKILIATARPSKKTVEQILAKAKKKKGLTLMDVGYLINVNDRQLLRKIFAAAGKVKDEIYGERLVLFAPLYLSSYCVNECAYCGFHASNKAPRKKLTMKEIARQTRILEDMGHKRLLLEFGEHPSLNPIEYVVAAIKTIYKTRSKKGAIRRVNVNIAATSAANYRKLKKAGIGTYQLFQETYHRATYAQLHTGPKASYERQLFAHDSAFAGGIDDVGLGVLFGLYDYRFEVLGLVSHAHYLEKKFGVGPHTLSVPRFQPASSVGLKLPYAVSEGELLKIIAVLRLAVPYTGMIISTRERAEVRRKAFQIGISQTSAASRTAPGGYGKAKRLEQFRTADHRSMGEFVRSLLQERYIPSFCTACYRTGRTGKAFMEIAKPGNIHNFCRPNAILTFKEYIEDYADAATKKEGERVIKSYWKKIPSLHIRQETAVRLLRIENGERDIYF